MSKFVEDTQKEMIQEISDKLASRIKLEPMDQHMLAAEIATIAISKAKLLMLACSHDSEVYNWVMQ